MFKVEKVYRVPYLAEVSLEVVAGECVSIMGASGVGKSVLLRALADLEPHHGEVWLQDQAQTAQNSPQWRRQVMWFGAETAWWHDSVQAHFEEVAKWVKETQTSEKESHKNSKKTAEICQNAQSCYPFFDLNNTFRQRLEAGIAWLGLKMPILQQPVWQLSSGEKQRLALLRGLLLNPQVLLLDEITANLDEQSTRQVEALVQNYVLQPETQRCAIWVTHDTAQSLRVASRRLWLTAEGLQLEASQ